MHEILEITETLIIMNLWVNTYCVNDKYLEIYLHMNLAIYNKYINHWVNMKSLRIGFQNRTWSSFVALLGRIYDWSRKGHYFYDFLDLVTKGSLFLWFLGFSHERVIYNLYLKLVTKGSYIFVEEVKMDINKSYLMKIENCAFDLDFDMQLVGHG